MSLPTVMKQLRALSYSEMMVLGEYVADELNAKKLQDAVPGRLVADTLASLTLPEHKFSDMMKQEEKILREIFRIKRTISVRKEGNGWKVECSTLAAGTATGLELRPLFAAMLDQLVTMHALTKG